MPEFISFNFVETDGKNCTGYMTIAKDGFWIHKEDAVKAMEASSNSLQQLKAKIQLSLEQIKGAALNGDMATVFRALNQTYAELSAI